MSQSKPLHAYEAFLARPLPNAPSDADTEARVLGLFRDTARDVPAYRDHLAAVGIDPAAIGTLSDFAAVPPVSKANYIQRHPLADLCRGGSIDSCETYAVSSGSTGKPTFWPRSFADELAVAARFEQIFVDAFAAETRSTLAVICFALGTWVGGMFTAACSRLLAQKGYRVGVVTPGNKPDDILRVVGEIGPLYDQVVLLGYPPFLKDVIDTRRARGGDWGDDRTRLVMAGEVFSEEWRALVCERIGTRDPGRSTASIYGTADAGVLGNETPVSVAIRRHLAANPAVAMELYGESRLPTMVQYDPLSRYFEAVDSHLLFTGDNGIPLIRYDILDKGGVMPFADMMGFLRGHGFDPFAGLDSNVRELPFVWVFGRSDFTVSFYGANVYPENVTVGLEQPGIHDWTTGKFVLEAVADENQDFTLHIAVELAPGEVPSDTLESAAAESISLHLRRLNGEFATYVPADKQLPRVTVHPTGDADYFPVGVKHRYTRQ